MNIKELYKEALMSNENHLILFLDFLINEKKVVKMDDKTSELERYFSEKNKPRMNGLLKAYAETPRGKRLLGVEF